MFSDKIKTGDTCVYSRNFLRSIGAYDYATATMRFTVLSLDSRCAVVLTDYKKDPIRILLFNLIREQDKHLESR